MDRRTYLGVFISAAITGISGCLSDDTAGTDAGPVGRWANGEIEFGLPPFQDAEELLQEYDPVFEWIQDGFDGIDSVDGVTTTSYSAVVESVISGHTELANLSPIIYVLAAEDGVHPLVINWSHGREAYHTYIATRRDSGIETLTDLAGRTIAMVDPLSTSGGLFPRYMLAEAGLDAGDIDSEPEDFEIEWAFGHSAALSALEAGHVDAAAYGDFQHPDDDEIVKIAESDPIPFDPIVAKPDTPEEVRDALIDRLLDTPPEVLEEHRVDQFGEISPGTYEPVRKVATEMGVDIADIEQDNGG